MPLSRINNPFLQISSAGSAASPALTTSSDTNTGIFFPAADTIAFAEGGAEIARFDSSGNLGIGTASPTSKLHVVGATSATSFIKTTTTNSYNNFYTDGGTTTNSGYTGVFNSSNTRIAYLGFWDGNNIVNMVEGAYGLTFGTNNVERMRIDSSGNVGIGTSLPLSTAKVTIKQASGGGAGSRQLHLEQSNTTDGYDLTCDSANGHLDFARYVSSSANTRMRLDADGNLILAYGGQVVTSFAAPQGMTISSLDNVALQYYLRKGNQVEARIGFKASTDSNFYVGSGGGTGPGGIGAYGVYLTNLGSSWNAVSDERKKTIVEPIENAAEKVSSLRAVIGYYNNDESQTRRPFLIAQDVQSVLPEAVNIQDIETGTLGMSYTDTIPLLVAAIKEQQALITAQAAIITALTARVDTQAADIAELKTKVA
jgi:hypothetical protein